MRIDKIEKEMETVPGWFSGGDAESLYPFVSKLKKGSLLVEIGTYKGRSTLFFRLCNPKIKILTIDICSVEGRTEGIEAEVPVRINPDVLHKGNIFQVIGDSHEVVKLFNWPIDFLFIDSLHTYKDTIDTLEEWGRFVFPKGYVALHDVCNSFPGVEDAINTFLVDKKFKKVLDGQLVILQKCE